MHGNGLNIPYGADQTAYLVVDRQGRPEQKGLYCEVEIEVADLETIVADLLAGQFNDPIRVVAFNTLEHWSQDISRQIAAEIQTLCDIVHAQVPEHIGDFVHSHTGPIQQHPRARWHDGAPMVRSNKMLTH